MESAAKPRTNRDELESVATTRNHREEIAHSVSTTLDALFGEGYNKELRGQIKHTINLVEKTIPEIPDIFKYCGLGFWGVPFDSCDTKAVFFSQILILLYCTLESCSNFYFIDISRF